MKYNGQTKKYEIVTDIALTMQEQSANDTAEVK
jgi:hypothetical protein